MNQTNVRHRKGFYAAMATGLAFIAVLIALSVTTGLPGMKNTATSDVNGRSVIGKTASD
jgi:hypothetical protein